MKVDVREDIHLGDYSILVRINRSEFIERVQQGELARMVTEKIADKLATCLWDRIEPKILQAITEGLR